MSDIKYMDLKEFRDSGYLLEANRQFFHPLGLALAVGRDNNTGELHLHGIWDYRDDPEGMLFDEITEEEVAKAELLEQIRLEREAKKAHRMATLGYDIQPLR